MEWRKELWGVLTEYRNTNPLIEKFQEVKNMRKGSSVHIEELEYVSKGQSQLANFKIFLKCKD